MHAMKGETRRNKWRVNAAKMTLLKEGDHHTQSSAANKNYIRMVHSKWRPIRYFVISVHKIRNSSRNIAYKADAIHARVASVRFIFVQYCND